MVQDKLKATIRDVANFPKEGIIFKDITPVLADAKLCSEIVDELVEVYKDQQLDAIAGIESRGFFFGFLLANRLGIPFIPIRKAGKLPFKTVSVEYSLEYGTAKIEMNIDAVTNGMRVLVHDDLLATGGTAAAAAELIRRQGGLIAGFGFIINLAFLNGSKNLTQFSTNIYSMLFYGLNEGDIDEPTIVVPNTLEEAFAELSKSEGVDTFASEPESDVNSYHNSLGRFLRNEWGLWQGTNPLCLFFYSIGIKHADDMSSIILTSLHRHINKKDINLKEQVKFYWKHWLEHGEDFLPPNIKGISEEYLEHFNNLK